MCEYFCNFCVCNATRTVPFLQRRLQNELRTAGLRGAGFGATRERSCAAVDRRDLQRVSGADGAARAIRAETHRGAFSLLCVLKTCFSLQLDIQVILRTGRGGPVGGDRESGDATAVYRRLPPTLGLHVSGRQTRRRQLVGRQE